MLNVGYNNYVAKNKITAIVEWRSNSIKRMCQAKKETLRLVDLTQGRRSKTVIITNTGDYILSAISTTYLVKRYNNDDVIGEVDENA